MITKLILPKYVTDFMAVFSKAGYEIYIVGGAVRDLFLSISDLPNRPNLTYEVDLGAKQKPDSIKNWDFATNATPEQIQKLFPDSFYNNNYGTVSIPTNISSSHSRPDRESISIDIDPHFRGDDSFDKTVIFEVTPFRKESNYSDSRHPDKIDWAKTIEEDLSRRDFTINSIAYDGKKLIDITGGIEDLKNKLIRAVGDPDKRFSEDGLRLMRAIRFASELGFLIEDNTLTAIKKNAELIKNISWERIATEFLKILASEHPAEGVLFLRSCNLLKEILPELDNCFSIEQKSPGRHHIYDVGTHSIEALRHCSSSDPITRFATLIHDIGKAEAFAKDDTGLITFHNHEHIGAKMASKIADRFHLPKEYKKKLVTLVRFHMFSVTENQTDKALRRFIRNVGVENLDDILAVRLGDRIGSGAKPTSWRTELFKKRLVEVQNIPFTIKDLRVNGNDVMDILKIKPGPKVGEILEKIFEKVDNQELENKREDLLKEIIKYKSN